MANNTISSPVKKTGHRVFCINERNSSLYAYKNHAYHVYRPKQQGLIQSAMNTIIADYEIMLSHYARVFIARIDLHPRRYCADNTQVQEYLNQLVKRIEQHYKTKVIFHCAREQDTSDREHYHLAIMVSGHRVNHHSKLLAMAESLWKRLTNGTVASVDNPYCKVCRGNKASLKAAIYRSSYLAKKHTKERNGKTKGFLHNKLNASKKLEPSSDLMLVDPHITFSQKQRAQQHKQAAGAKQATPSPANTPQAKRRQYSWFTQLSHAQQLKECIASRSNSLTHLNPYPDQFDVITLTADFVITQLAPHEPKNDHFFYDH
ncbi:MAG: YagK/YfjJ domain-containing protein [Shewanella sp.]